LSRRLHSDQAKNVFRLTSWQCRELDPCAQGEGARARIRIWLWLDSFACSCCTCIFKRIVILETHPGRDSVTERHTAKSHWRLWWRTAPVCEGVALLLPHRLNPLGRRLGWIVPRFVRLRRRLRRLRLLLLLLLLLLLRLLLLLLLCFGT
jgi:hypothetical protein